MSYIYVGTKQSDLDRRDRFFSHSIVYYGEPRADSSVYSQKIRNDNKYEKPFIDFVIGEMKTQLRMDPHCQFVFYANKLAWRLLEFAGELKPNITAINPFVLLNALDNKFVFRAWYHTKTGLSPYRIMAKHELINILLSPSSTYVVQKSFSAGGEGTYLWNDSSRDVVYPQLSPSQLYLVSEFIDGPSISCTIICHSNGTIVFPLNVQRISVNESTRYRFLFEGSDFIKGRGLPRDVQAKVKQQALSIGKDLFQMGYRGICGIDFMLHDGLPLIMEINPRFLGSSFLIDTALMDCGLPSLARLHTLSFLERPLDDGLIYELEHINIPYYSRVATNRGESTEDYIRGMLAAAEKDITVFMDGFRMEELSMAAPNAYLFRLRGTTK